MQRVILVFSLHEVISASLSAFIGSDCCIMVRLSYTGESMSDFIQIGDNQNRVRRQRVRRVVPTSCSWMRE